MAENSNPTFRDLTAVEAWRLIKRFLGAVLACVLVFVLPYVLFILGLRGANTMAGVKGISTKWIGYLCLVVVLYYVVFRIHDLCSSLAEFFTELANLTKELPRIKRTAFAVLLVCYFLGWIHLPTITFFVSVLVIMPVGFTYDEYRRLLNDKQSGGEDV